MSLPDPPYDDGAIVLYRGDCLDLLPHIAERHGRPAHLIEDPPYSARTKAGARSISKKRGGKGPSGGRDDHREGELGGVLVPFATTVDVVRRSIELANAERWSIVFCDLVHAAGLETDPPEGLRHLRTAAWVKPDCAPQLTGDRPAQGFETCAILAPEIETDWSAIVALHAADEACRWNGIDGQRGARGVWTHGVERDVPWHPTPKPVGLLRKIIRAFTDPGDLIIDPFGGSASTAVACRYEGRRCVAIELDETFAALAAQRLAEGRARPADSIVEVDPRQIALFAEVGT